MPLALIVLAAVSISAADDAYQQAMTLFKSGDYTGAQQQFQLFAAQNPDSADRKAAEFYAIKCDYMLGQYAAMEQKIESLRQGDPQHPSLDDLQFLRGMAYVKMKNYDAARSIFTNFPKLYPRSSYTSKIAERVSGSEYHPIMIFFDAEMYEEFLRESAAFRQSNPADAFADDLMFMEMLALRKLGRGDEARRKANDLIAQYSASPYAKQMGGKDGRTEDQGADEFDRAMQIHDSGDYEGARTLFQQFLANYPDNWRCEYCRYMAAGCLYRAKKYDGFIDETNLLLSRKLIDKQQVHDLLFLETVIFNNQGKGEKTRPILDYLEANYPYSPLRETYVQMRLESYLFDRNLDSITTATADLDYILRFYHDQLNKTRQKRWYVKNVELGGRLYAKLWRVAEGLELMKRELEEIPDARTKQEIAVAYVQLLWDLGKKAEAKTFIEKFIVDVPNPSASRNHLISVLSLLYTELGDVEKAFAVRALKSYQHNKEDLK